MSFHYEASSFVTEVYLVGSFNHWDTKRDKMVLRRSENGLNIFELYLELYSGLYYYKFYIPATNSYTYDILNPNKVSDSFGGFNSVLEIPIQIHIKHPLLQSAQMKADIWWNRPEDEEKEGSVYRTISYGNLGVLAASSNRLSDSSTVKRVWRTDDIPMSGHFVVADQFIGLDDYGYDSQHAFVQRLLHRIG